MPGRALKTAPLHGDEPQAKTVTSPDAIIASPRGPDSGRPERRTSKIGPRVAPRADQATSTNENTPELAVRAITRATTPTERVAIFKPYTICANGEPRPE